jgi:hypothetical protein
MVLISATAGDDRSRAYDLHGQGISAFGYYFTRALKEDWACADTTPDGVLTARELVGYLTDRLKAAYAASAIDGPMVPTKLTKDDYAFLAYDPSRYSSPGDRGRIVSVSASVPSQWQASIRFGSGESHTCRGTCSFFVSAALQSDVSVSAASTRRPPSPGGALTAPDFDPIPPPTSGAVVLQDLIKRGRESVAGVDLSIR